VPVFQRMAEAAGWELRIFNRDGKKILGVRRPDPAAYPDANHDLMVQFLKKDGRGEWASLPVAVVYTKDFKELHRYLEFPVMYHKDRIRTQQGTPRAGESADQAKARSAKEFLELQASPFFDVWASAAVDEILSGLYEKHVLEGAPRA
jgi:hypothetical protein